ncbi:MAG: hypothetical protein LUC33_04545 [Prevotellaceae bacterium]|nr:hypothetical protein [Prevotellaceae bacterium]
MATVEQISYFGTAGLQELVARIKTYADAAAKSAVADFDHTIASVVTELPDAASADSSKIYLIPDAASVEAQNVYDEYIIVSGAWEKIGSFKADVDLSGYKVKEITVSGDYITVTSADGVYTLTVSVPEATTSAAGLMSAADKSKLDGIDADTLVNTSDLSDYAKTEDIPSLDGYVTEDALSESLTDYAKESELSDYAKSSDLDGYVKSEDIVEITAEDIDAICDEVFGA